MQGAPAQNNTIPYNAEEACLIAGGDAKHDFGTNYGPPKTLQRLVGELTQPNRCGTVQLPPGDIQDHIVEKFLLKPGQKAHQIKVSSPYFSGQLQTAAGAQQYFGKLPDGVEGLFNEQIRNKYNIWYVRRRGVNAQPFDSEEAKAAVADEKLEAKTKDVYGSGNNGPESVSWIQMALQGAGITDDVFVICDVAYSSVRKDLTFAGRAKTDGEGLQGVVNSTIQRPSQKFFWLQTPQTQYDPGSKSNLGTDRGYGWRGGANDGKDSHFFFAWQNVNPGQGGRRAAVYEPWPGLLETNEMLNAGDFRKQLDTEAADYPNNMLYTNQRLVITVRCSLAEAQDYKKHDAVLLIHDPRTQKMTYADKSLAAKTKATFAMKTFMSFFSSNAFDKIREYVSKLKLFNMGGGQPKSEPWSSKYHVLAKRIGDASQAHATLQKSIPYYTGTNPNFRNGTGITAGETNGYHMFVSYDRIACVQALKFGAPMVLYDQPGGNALIFVSQDLTTVCKRYSQVSSKSVTDHILVGGAIAGVPQITTVLQRIGVWYSDGFSVYSAKLAEWAEKTTQFARNTDATLQMFVGNWWIYADAITNLWEVEDKITQSHPTILIRSLSPKYTTIADTAGEIAQGLQSLLPAGTNNAVANILNNLQEYVQSTTVLRGTADVPDLFTDLKDIADRINAISTYLVPTLAALGTVDAECKPRNATGMDVITRFDAILTAYNQIFAEARGYCNTLDEIAQNISNYENTIMGRQLNTVPPHTLAVQLRSASPIAELDVIFAAMPKGLAQNLKLLTPWDKKAARRGGARGTGSAADEYVKEFGAMFYRDRDNTYQIETLLRPLWDIIRKSKAPEGVKYSFRRGLKQLVSIYGDIADAAPDSFTRATAAMAKSASEAVITMLKESPDEGQSGGGENAPPNRRAKTMGRIDAGLRSRMSAAAGLRKGKTSKLIEERRGLLSLSPPTLLDAVRVVNDEAASLAQKAIAAERIDSFYKLLAAVLFSQLTTSIPELEDGPGGAADFLRFKLWDGGARSIDGVHLAQLLMTYLLPQPFPPPEDWTPIDAKLDDMIVEQDIELLGVLGQPKPEYLFDALASQIEHYDEPLLHIGNDSVHFVKLLSKYTETAVALHFGEPDPHPELSSEFETVFPATAIVDKDMQVSIRVNDEVFAALDELLRPVLQDNVQARTFRGTIEGLMYPVAPVAPVVPPAVAPPSFAFAPLIPGVGAGGGKRAKTLRKRRPRKRTIRKNKKSKRTSTRGKGKRRRNLQRRRTRQHRKKQRKNHRKNKTI